jgi:hypothetical protein
MSSSPLINNVVAAPTNSPSTDDSENEDKMELKTFNPILIIKDDTGRYIYLCFHMMMSFVAIFLTWKCNGGKFDLLSFIIALFFPYIYIIYILATRGMCAA